MLRKHSEIYEVKHTANINCHVRLVGECIHEWGFVYGHIYKFTCLLVWRCNSGLYKTGFMISEHKQNVTQASELQYVFVLQQHFLAHVKLLFFLIPLI